MEGGNRLPHYQQIRIKVKVMVTEIRPQPSSSLFVKPVSKTQVTVFHCCNALNQISISENAEYEIQSIKMPCSSLIREVFLLRAFEAGADVVIVLACPEGSCRYLEGNIRARKRVERVKKILDEIGLDSRRLDIYNLPHEGPFEVSQAVAKTLSNLADPVPDPAAKLSFRRS
jgi:F420-non-reducing hydrogenase iron-sulfur subunit